MKKTWSISVTSFLLVPLFLTAVACDSKKNMDASIITDDAEDMAVVYGKYSIKPFEKKSINYSVAAVFDKSSLSYNGNEIAIQEISVAERYGTCSEFPLTAEMSAARCSGVLIKNNLVVTAAHCFGAYKTCEDMAIAFGFQNQEDHTAFSLSKKDVYNCKKVKIDTDKDIAYIQLDRKVPQFKEPQKFPKFTVGALLGQRVYTLGFPLGTSLKKTEGYIRGYNPETKTMETTLDAFDRDSGSPVFLEGTNQLMGILLNGESDFYTTTTRTCNQIIQCREHDQCLGESVITIDQVF